MSSKYSYDLRNLVAAMLKKNPRERPSVNGILREQQAGAEKLVLARKHSVSKATIYNWKAKFAGMGVSGPKRLKLS